MEYSTIRPGQEISAEGVVYDKGSVYDRLQKLTDLRKARGKRYRLTTLLMIVLLAKLSGANSLTEIAEWGVYHQAELETLLRIHLKRMPERSTYRRILAYKVYEQEIERMVAEHNQTGERGRVFALDGKALLGMSKREDGTPEYALSVYDVTAGKTMAQVEVGSKENEITRAPEVVKLAKIAGKWSRATRCTPKNALPERSWTKRAITSSRSRKTNRLCTRTSSPCSLPNIPNPVLARSKPIFSRHRKLTRGTEGSRFARSPPARCSILMLPGQGSHRFIAWNAKSNGGDREGATKPLTRSSLASPACHARRLALCNSWRSAALTGASRQASITPCLRSVQVPPGCDAQRRCDPFHHRAGCQGARQHP